MAEITADCPHGGHGRVTFNLSESQAGSGKGVHRFDGEVPCSAHGSSDGTVVRLKLRNNRGSISVESIERS